MARLALFVVGLSLVIGSGGALAQSSEQERERFREFLGAEAQRRVISAVKLGDDAKLFLDKLQRDALREVYDPGSLPEGYRDLRPPPGKQAERAAVMKELPLPVRQQIVVRNYNSFLDVLAFEGTRAGVLDFPVIQKVWYFFCPLYPFC